MHKQMMGLVFCVAVLAMSATAQTTVTNNNDGTAGTIPVYTGSATLGNSVITQSSTKVGIGTTTPYSALDVHLPSGGQDGLTLSIPTVGNAPFLTWKTGDSSYNLFSMRYYGGAGGFFTIGTGDGGGFTRALSISAASGNVGIMTNNPLYSLDVNGEIHSYGGFVFPDGTTQSTAFIPANCGADYAESVGVSGDRTKYEPGDILVIDPDAPGKFLKSNQAYSTLVAGIYSTKPGFVGRLHPEDANADKTEVPMAMVGRVPTKVTAENGPIKVGDLLVASSTPGRAMKGTDRTQMLGAVVGKALDSLDSGTGVIEVLVTLQ